MKILIVSENPPLADKLRLILSRVGHDCPAENLVALEKAAQTLTLHNESGTSVIVALGKDGLAALQTIEQLRQKTKGLIIAVGSKDAELILAAVHAGADDYIDESLVEDELPRSLARQCAAKGLTTPQGELVLILSGSGGSGRSQIAANLSVSLARIQGRSCLIELDLCGGNCASMLSLKPRHTILDLCRYSDKLDRKTLEKTLIAHESGVSLLPAPNEVVRPDTIRGDFVERFVKETRSMFPQVIIDYQDLWNEDLLKRLAGQNARILLVTRLDFNSVCNASRTLNQLERLGIENQRIQIIANRYGEFGSVSPKKIEQTLSIHIDHLLPDDPGTVLRSINSGIPYVIESPTLPLSKALSGLADSLVGVPRQKSAVSTTNTSSTTAEPRTNSHGVLNIRSMLCRLV
ncbi:P-loop NTPase [bacterium]|nr:P-loop NTPase [bacterium]